MGLFGRGNDDGGGASRTFQMREKLMSVGDDYWIEDESGHRAYKVDGKAMHVRDTFILEDAEGREVAKIQERKLSLRDKMEIERPSGNATVRKRLLGIRLAGLGDLRGALKAIAAALEIARGRKDTEATATIASYAAYLFMENGDVRGAASLASDALASDLSPALRATLSPGITRI